MSESYVIAMDVHSYSCHVLTLTPTGRRRDERTVTTDLPSLREAVRACPRPRVVVFEEGPLAGWLSRGLKDDADAVVVAETRRNAYVAKDGDKSDPIDAAKLAQLYRGGFIRAVHHADDARRAMFKELVLFHRSCVADRIARANRVIWAVRAHGVVITERRFKAPADRAAVEARLPRDRMLRLRVRMLLADYDLAVEHEAAVERELIRRARKIKMIQRFMELPGVGPIRAATFWALIDTPFRFRGKSALWRYMGIGLQRRSSGRGVEHVGTTPACNHPLKDIILGAAATAARCDAANPFKQQYRRCIDRGLSPRLARRTVARTMAAVMWGMFKSQTAYRPDRIGPDADAATGGS